MNAQPDFQTVWRVLAVVGILFTLGYAGVLYWDYGLINWRRMLFLFFPVYGLPLAFLIALRFTNRATRWGLALFAIGWVLAATFQ
jgi:hypothetical protein